jgi:very-short-patch-repair endonuclease
VDVIVALRAHGGAARWSQLTGKVSRRALQRAVRDGDVDQQAGVYSMAPSERARVLARAMRGTRCHRTAAIHWKFAVPPVAWDEKERHDIAIPAKAQRKRVPTDVRLHYLTFDQTDVTDEVLTSVATAAFCLRDQSLREALSIGDSALASGQVTFAQLADRVAKFRGPRRSIALARLAMLNPAAANAFESSCRALLLEAGIHGFEPQVDIGQKENWIARVDLAHRRLRIVIECDGFEHHGTLDAMTSDCIRHTRLTAAGWRTLRFTWYQVMYRADWVLRQVRDTIAAASPSAPYTDR